MLTLTPVLNSQTVRFGDQFGDGVGGGCIDDGVGGSIGGGGVSFLLERFRRQAQGVTASPIPS